MAKKTIINKEEYSFVDIKVLLFGQYVGGLRGIEYVKRRNKEALYGAGKYARSIQQGRVECSGTLTLLQSELNALNRSAKAAGYDDLLDVTFDIVVSYSRGGKVEVKTISGASVTEMPEGMNEGDLYSTHALPFVALNID